jgi:hypothetical protein
MSVVDELVTLLGLEVDPKAQGAASGFGKILGGVVTAAAAAGAALAAAASAVGAYAVMQADAIDKSGKMADAFGINFQAFQELEFAAQQSGAEVEEFRMDLENLSKTLDDNDALKEMGINAKDATGKLRSTDEVLMDIAGKFETLSKGEQNQFTDKLGLSPSALKVLQQGGKGLQGLRDQAKSLGIVLDDNAKNKAAKFQSSLISARSVVDGLGKSISVSLLPAMADSLDAFTAWIGKNKEFISSTIKQVVDGVALGFSMFGDAVSYLYKQFVRLIGPIEDSLGPLDATQAIAIAVAIAFGALAVAVISATWPFIAAAVAIAAVVVVLDDLYSAFTGGDSVIGGWVSQFAEAFPAITAGIMSLIDALGEIAAYLFGSMAESIKFFASVFGDVISAVVDLVKNFLVTLEAIMSGANPFSALSDFFQKEFDIILDLAGKIGEKITGLFSGLFGEEEVSVSASSASAPSAAPMGADVIKGGGSSSQTNTNTFNINGSGDPAAVANEIVKKGGLGQTLQQSSPGMTGPVTG